MYAMKFRFRIVILLSPGHSAFGFPLIGSDFVLYPSHNLFPRRDTMILVSYERETSQ